MTLAKSIPGITFGAILFLTLCVMSSYGSVDEIYVFLCYVIDSDIFMCCRPTAGGVARASPVAGARAGGGRPLQGRGVLKKTKLKGQSKGWHCHFE